MHSFQVPLVVFISTCLYSLGHSSQANCSTFKSYPGEKLLQRRILVTDASLWLGTACRQQHNKAGHLTSRLLHLHSPIYPLPLCAKGSSPASKCQHSLLQRPAAASGSGAGAFAVPEAGGSQGCCSSVSALVLVLHADPWR